MSVHNNNGHQACTLNIKNGKQGQDSQKVLDKKNCLNFKRKVLTVQEFCHKVKIFFA